jgi:hypothetical protein
MLVIMPDTELPYAVQCPHCAGRITRHLLRNKTEVKERLLDGTLTFYCVWCEQSRQPTAAEQDFLLQWIFESDAGQSAGVVGEEYRQSPAPPHFQIDWPIVLPDSVDVGDVVVSTEREWFTYGRVTEDRGRVYLGSSTELLVACYLASQHAGGRTRVWYADGTGTFTEYVYEVG